jgi:hypothetical protein
MPNATATAPTPSNTPPKIAVRTHVPFGSFSTMTLPRIPAMAIEFESVLKQAEGVNATGIPVPDHVVAGLGGAKNASVDVKVRKTGSGGNWYEYRVSIGNRGGYILSFSGAHRTASGLVAGDPLDVSVELASASA